MGDKKTTKTRETDPLLVRAWKALSLYEKATGSLICVLDQDLLPIKESFPEILNKRNTCVQYCFKYLSAVKNISKISDTRYSPCNKPQIDAVREAHRFGGSHIYMCEMGFMFWTSPLYSNGKFIGAVIGSGFSGLERREVIEALHARSKGAASREELEAWMDQFAHGELERIKSLADLLMICAEYLSTGCGEAVHEVKKSGSPSAYPMDKERLLLAALRRGDQDSGRKLLSELLDILFYANPGPLHLMRFRAIELVVLFSRAAMKSSPASGGSSATASYNAALLESNNRYFRYIQEAKSTEELTDMLHIIVERMSAQIFSFQGMCHASALRKAERFIWENYIRKISLQEIAAAAGLSAPYFSTIFKEEMGENLSSYLNRLRVEKARHMLAETDLTLNEIAASCGFEDQSWFSKIFKSFVGISPGKYRGSCGGGVPDSSHDAAPEEFAESLPAEFQIEV